MNSPSSHAGTSSDFVSKCSATPDTTTQAIWRLAEYFARASYLAPPVGAAVSGHPQLPIPVRRDMTSWVISP